MNLEQNDFEALALQLKLGDDFAFSDTYDNKIVYDLNTRILWYRSSEEVYCDYKYNDLYYIKNRWRIELNKNAKSFIADFVIEFRNLNLDDYNGYKSLNKLVNWLSNTYGRYLRVSILGCKDKLVVGFPLAVKAVDCDWYTVSSTMDQGVVYGIGSEIFVAYEGESYPYEKFYAMRNFI